MPSSDIQILVGSPLFQGIDAEPLQAALPTICHRKKFSANTIIASCDAPGELVYVVAEGLLRVSIDAPSGRSVVLRLCGPGQVLGEISMVDEKARSATIETVTDSVVYWMSRDDLETLAWKHPVIWRNMATLIALRLRQATGQIGALSSLDVRGRLAIQLLSLFDDFGEKRADGTELLPLHITQSDLADMVGATRVSAHGALSSWKRRSLLNTNSDGFFVLLNRKQIEKELDIMRSA